MVTNGQMQTHLQVNGMNRKDARRAVYGRGRMDKDKTKGELQNERIHVVSVRVRNRGADRMAVLRALVGK